MTDLEPRLRERLAPAAAPPRAMPPGIGRRVAARRVGKTALLTAGLAAFVVAVAFVVPHAERQAPPAGGGGQSVVPTPSAASIGPTVVTPAGWPVMTFGGDFTPYIDHEIDTQGRTDYGVVGPKQVVGYGTVDGVPWSLTGFNTDGKGDWGGDAGVCGELFLGDGGSLGGGGVVGTPCGHFRGATGVMFNGDQVSAYASVLSPGVATVEFRLSDGTIQDATILPGPSGMDANFFVLFVPNGIAGDAVFLDDVGNVISKEGLCLSGVDTPHSAGSTASCSDSPAVGAAAARAAAASAASASP